MNSFVRIEEIHSVAPVRKIGPLQNISQISDIDGVTLHTMTDMRKHLLVLQYQATKSGAWGCYQKIQELQAAIRCRQEIIEKYPYDGKSTFAELLAKEMGK